MSPRSASAANGVDTEFLPNQPTEAERLAPGASFHLDTNSGS